LICRRSTGIVTAMNKNPFKNYSKYSLAEISRATGGRISPDFLSKIRSGRKKANAFHALLIEIGTIGDIPAESWGLVFFDIMKEVGFLREKTKRNQGGVIRALTPPISAVKKCETRVIERNENELKEAV